MTSDAAPRPRVLLLSSHAQRGGAESYLLRLLQLLEGRMDAQVIVLEDGPLVPLVRELGVPVSVVTAGRRAGLVAAAWPLRRAIARAAVDVVHANGVKSAVVASLAAVGRPERLLWVKHDHSWDGALVRSVARRCDVVVGVSRSVLAATRGMRVDARVVPPGVEVKEVDPAAARATLRAAVGAGADAQLLVAVGRLDPAKGFDEAIDALARVRAVAADTQLVIVGGDDPRHPGEAARLRARAETAGVADFVHLLGFRDDAQVLLAGGDALLVTSRAVDARGMGREGFGLVAAEALAHGVPVVAYAEGAVPEVVGEAGILVPSRDVEALARAAADVIGDRGLRERMVAVGRQRARGHSSRQWADTMLALYTELAARSGSRARQRQPSGSGRTS